MLSDGPPKACSGGMASSAVNSSTATGVWLDLRVMMILLSITQPDTNHFIVPRQAGPPGCAQVRCYTFAMTSCVVTLDRLSFDNHYARLGSGFSTGLLSTAPL